MPTKTSKFMKRIGSDGVKRLARAETKVSPASPKAAATVSAATNLKLEPGQRDRLMAASGLAARSLLRTLSELIRPRKMTPEADAAIREGVLQIVAVYEELELLN